MGQGFPGLDISQDSWPIIISASKVGKGGTGDDKDQVSHPPDTDLGWRQQKLDCCVENELYHKCASARRHGIKPSHTVVLNSHIGQSPIKDEVSAQIRQNGAVHMNKTQTLKANTVTKTLKDSGRVSPVASKPEECVLSEINCDSRPSRGLPQIAQAIVDNQKYLINDIWPDTTAEARVEFPEFCRMYQEIKSWGLPNFLGAKIPIESGLCIKNWRKLLLGYHDEELCVYLEFGWPIGYHASKEPISVNENHRSAQHHIIHLNRFIEKELSHKALVGPFKSLPFEPWCRLSPLMTRAKRMSSDRRVIMDLSFPQGKSPNDGIDINSHFGKDISYSLPTVWDLVTKIQEQGKGSWMWKADLSRAYRQLRIDPLDTPFLGLKVGSSIFLDLCPAFGCKSSSSICQRMSNAVSYILNKKGHFVLSYLDDFAGCSNSKLKANQAYSEFKETADTLGLALAIDKCVEPSTEVEWLGFVINTIKMTVKIPHQKLREVLTECKRWENRRNASKQMLQSIVGKLVHISTCVRQGRRFVARILDTLRAMGIRTWTHVDKDMLLDIKWFERYAECSNGIHLFDSIRPDISIECDSSLLGAGGHAGRWYYSWVYRSDHRTNFPAIHHLEALNVLIAYRTLAPLFEQPGAIVTIFTDNSASSFSLQTGKTKDKILASVSRQLWLEAAKSDHIINIKHKPGHELDFADALSRGHFDKARASTADSHIRANNLVKVNPMLNDCVFFNHDL